MKKLILVLLSLSLGTAFAEDLKLEQFDQEKLADILGRLPLSVRTREIVEISEPVEGISVYSEFPKSNDLGFKARCSSLYFNGSPYASSSVCTLSVDDQNPLMDMKYDERKLVLKDSEIAKALFENISYGKPERDYRSFGKDKGLSFEGKQTYIFHYRMKCSEERCLFNFSKIIGRDDDQKSTRKNRLFESRSSR